MKPFVVVVDDYHDIEHIANSIMPTARHLEVGVTYSGLNSYLMFVGIIYRGETPSVREALDLAKNIGIKVDFIDGDLEDY